MADDFPGDAGDSAVSRESISGLTDPMWYKVKTGSRWRGAAYVDPSGQAWLCAAGYRRAGEISDFYKTFMTQVATRGADFFLPTQQDRDRLTQEDRQLRLEAWEQETHDGVRALARSLSSGRSSHQVVLAPDGRELVEVTLDLQIELIDGDTFTELTVTMTCSDPSRYAAFQWCEALILVALHADVQAWGSLPVVGSSVHSLVLDVEESARWRSHLADTEAKPGGATPGQVAHYAHRENLMMSTVNGDAVKATCGAWFVPTQDHLSLEVCPYCDAIMRLLPGDST